MNAKHRQAMEELGRQLQCPSGSNARKVGDDMFTSNQNMIYKTIDAAVVSEKHRVLELGFGNGKHLIYLQRNAKYMRYTGVDISPAMVETARDHHARSGFGNQLTFLLVEGQGMLPLEENYFDRFFTVNTLYFWPDLHLQLTEIYRVLKPGGHMAIGYIEKKFGQSLPFTQQGFRFLEQTEVEDALTAAGFQVLRTTVFLEEVRSKTGQTVNRSFCITTAKKA